jgi:hypothetical protein
MNRISLLPRWCHQLYARGLGYFWLPCPLCGQMSGGHEWKDRNGLPSSVPAYRYGESPRYEGICPQCTREGLGVRLGEVIR